MVLQLNSHVSIATHKYQSQLDPCTYINNIALTANALSADVCEECHSVWESMMPSVCA